MARPREPLALLEAKGKKHLTKAERETRKKEEVKAPCDNVTPPAWLTKKEKEKFEEIAGQLLDIGIMSDLDCDMLARYVRASAEYEKITRELRKIRFTPGGKNVTKEEKEMLVAGNMARYNYIQKMQIRAEKQCNADARELGLTISSRCRLVMPKQEETQPENKFLKHA